MIMPSWIEVHSRAVNFSKEWEGAFSEAGEKQTFWNEFFLIFGLPRKSVASFEEPIVNIGKNYSFIDLFWPGVLLVEHKTRGKSLSKAESQAFQYIRDLIAENRHDEVPRYVVVSDFAKFAIYDLESDLEGKLLREFPLADLPMYIRDFAFMKGEKTFHTDPEDPINIRASSIMGDLHNTLKEGGYDGHPLERFMMRVLFCLFAEDSFVFEPGTFSQYIKNCTKEDGSDLGLHLAQFFEVLDTPKEKRQDALDEDLAGLPYVNGSLFTERLPFTNFNSDMRKALLTCTNFSWNRISPAVFGSIFQSILPDVKRRQQGQHYTSERDIMKVVKALFLDDLRAEFNAIKVDDSTRRRQRLIEFHKKLRSLKFLDPACGCGNFLVLTYRELRKIELELLQVQHTPGQDWLQMDGKEAEIIQVNTDQFFGIEILEWPARIAETSLWLMDQQMNQEASVAFGQQYRRLPIKKSPTIVCANALQVEWKTILSPDKNSYILGNPPFVGHHLQTREQKVDQHAVLHNIPQAGILDYVCNWYVKASEYIQQTRISCAFVSTNSITQGEQVCILWQELFTRYCLKIHFAYRTFKWESEARGKAHVHVVIIGFGAFDSMKKRIYDCSDKNTTETEVKNISPYLVEGNDMVLRNRSKPLSRVPGMKYGNKPTDGGNFLLTEKQMNEILKAEPESEKYIKRYIGAREVIDDTARWCLWLDKIQPEDLKRLTMIRKRVEAVRDFRLASKAPSTQEYAKFPTKFRQIAQPKTNFIVIPGHSSETRKYIPIMYFTPDYIVSNALFFIPDAELYHFGVLSSEMHMAWVRQVCGRLESRFRYSKDIVYNNYPWPPSPTDRQIANVETKAKAVIDARAIFPKSTISSLYDPVTMPPELTIAHCELDRAVDLCYRSNPFTNDRTRVEYLFNLYATLSTPLIPAITSATKTHRQVKK